MLLIGNIYDELNKAFVSVLRKSEANRLTMHQEFASFYENDYERICEYLKVATKDNPFSEETLKRLRFRHVNVIGKMVNRMTSGIFTKDPIIEFESQDSSAELDTANEKLEDLLTRIKFIAKVKEAFKKAVYYNVTEAYVVYDMNTKEIRIDIVTPNDYVIETKQDYLQKYKIAVRKADERGAIYWSFWSDTEHYILKGGEKIAPDNNPGMINPYAAKLQNEYKKYAIPFAVLRIDEGCDYFGEPNWNIFLHQKNLDIRLTDLNESELKTLMQIYFGINTNFTDKDTFRAGDFKQVNNVKEEDKDPRIDSVEAKVDYGSVRENVNWHNDLVMSSEGINNASASTDQNKPQSGAAKVIDEIELYEKREEYKTALYHFMQHLLNVIRVVWNYYNPNDKLADNGFDIRFIDAKMFESIEQKKKRYDMAIEYGYIDEVDITMEELEISEEDAKKRIIERKTRRKELGLMPEPMPPVNGNEPPKIPPVK